jgi:hypothetical protein
MLVSWVIKIKKKARKHHIPVSNKNQHMTVNGMHINAEFI